MNNNKPNKTRLPIEALISRIDEQTLQEMLDKHVIDLVTLLDPEFQTPSKLRELLIDLKSKEGLLLDSSTRSKLMDLLSVDEAKTLADHLNLSWSSDPYKRLSSYTPSRGSKNEEALFDFFGLTPPPVKEKETPPDQESIQPQYSLFPFQRSVLSDLKDTLNSESHKALIHMPTGAGKTRTTMNYIADHLNREKSSYVVWLARSSELCEQAIEEFKSTWNYFGNRELNIYRYWGDHEFDLSDQQNGMVVAGLSKLYNAAKNDISFISNLGEKASLIVMDEAHQAVADTYKLVLDSLFVMREDTKLIGLTATPGRTWSDISEDERLAEYFDRNKVDITTSESDDAVSYLIEEGYLADPEFTSLLYESGLELSDKDIQKIQKKFEIPNSVMVKMAENDHRNLAIIHRIEELAKRHNRILVFSLTADHSDVLASVLRTRGIQAFSITGKTNNFDRKRFIDEYKSDADEPIILCNYGVLTTGFDAPKTSAALIARPTKSLVLYSQMIGRAIRGPKAGGNEEAEIVTVLDDELPGFRDIAEAFTNWEDVWGSK